MERLTKRLSSGVVSWNYSNDCYGEDETRNKVFKSVHRQNACEKLAAIEDILGDEYDLDRLRELAEADREGRCVVLPCKIDDDVYINLFGRTLDATVISISELASTPTYKAMYGIRLCYIFKADDVGRTVFLTREAAEEALKAREQE